MYDGWRGRLYPEREPKRRWLELYAEQFDTVEVNSTFYRLARRSGVERLGRADATWFTFAVKASRYLTHIRRFVEIERGSSASTSRSSRCSRPAGSDPCCGSCRRTSTATTRGCGSWLAALDSASGMHTIEFRHPSWFEPAVMDALRAHRVALTVGDHPARRRFSPTGDRPIWMFVRFHYGHRGRRGNYSRPSEANAELRSLYTSGLVDGPAEALAHGRRVDVLAVALAACVLEQHDPVGVERLQRVVDRGERVALAGVAGGGDAGFAEPLDALAADLLGARDRVVGVGEPELDRVLSGAPARRPSPRSRRVDIGRHGIPQLLPGDRLGRHHEQFHLGSPVPAAPQAVNPRTLGRGAQRSLPLTTRPRRLDAGSEPPAIRAIPTRKRA